MLWKLGFDAFGRTHNFIIRSIKQKNVLHYGMGNRCEDGLYLLFLDYDDAPLSWVLDEVRLLQDRYVCDLGAGYVFKTKHGYHVVFLEKHPLGLVCRMLDCTSTDKNYRDVPMRYGRKIWVLRQSEKHGEKIRHVCTVLPSFGALSARSNAHTLYLRNVCGVKLIDGSNRFDKSTFVTIGYYYINSDAN